MKIVNYVYFEKPGELNKLRKVAEESSNEEVFKLTIQKEFNLDIIAADAVCKKFFNKLKRHDKK
jgi:hypothetical protein